MRRIRRNQIKSTLLHFNFMGSWGEGETFFSLIATAMPKNRHCCHYPMIRLYHIYMLNEKIKYICVKTARKVKIFEHHLEPFSIFIAVNCCNIFEFLYKQAIGLVAIRLTIFLMIINHILNVHTFISFFFVFFS